MARAPLHKDLQRFADDAERTVKQGRGWAEKTSKKVWHRLRLVGWLTVAFLIAAIVALLKWVFVGSGPLFG